MQRLVARIPSSLCLYICIKKYTAVNCALPSISVTFSYLTSDISFIITFATYWMGTETPFGDYNRRESFKGILYETYFLPRVKVTRIIINLEARDT